MDDIDHTQIDLEITDLLEQLNLCLEKIGRRIDESPQARSEVIRVMKEAARRTSQQRSTRVLMAAENARVYHKLEKTVAELDDYISETDRKMIAYANVLVEGIEELKKNREESITLFNDLMINIRDIGKERNLLDLRKKIVNVNQWLNERTVDDETMKEGHSATGFDQSSAPGTVQDVPGLGIGSEEEDTEGGRRERKQGSEEVRSSSEGSSSITSDNFSVLLVEYDTFNRLFNKMQIIEFAKENNLGVEVKVAKSGEKAILLHSQGASFDLVLMDMDMPARLTSGYEATTQLRSVFGVKSNIVGLTSSSESEEINELVGAGRLNGCIAKPLSDVKIDSLISKGKL
uniref:Response regulatory domain-containing protein n=1 Tax=Salix viminalis TaxID=40686 RepID=A0A6N2JY88_SALVM